jgi:hypothetical protein
MIIIGVGTPKEDAKISLVVKFHNQESCLVKISIYGIEIGSFK